MKKSTLVSSTMACFCLAAVTPLAAAPAPSSDLPPVVALASVMNPAATCQTDVHSFHAQLEKDGYWRGGSDYGYGYPMVGMGYYDSGDNGPEAHSVRSTSSYQNARPGYQIRILLASANILAQNGQQQGCEDVLDTTRAIYKVYSADMHDRGLQLADEPGWREKEIATARSVTADHVSFRSDELLDTAVRNPRDDSLGSVDDLVTNPKTGKIAYLVVARGGIFGFDKSYVPIPWNDFKVTSGTKFLVLDTTKATMQTAPKVSHNQAFSAAEFDQESQKIDAYWAAHMPVKSAN